MQILHHYNYRSLQYLSSTSYPPKQKNGNIIIMAIPAASIAISSCGRQLLPSIRRWTASNQRPLHRHQQQFHRLGNQFTCALFSTSSSSPSITPTNDDESTAAATKSSDGSNRKPRVLILGSGWAGFTLARRLQKSLFDVRVVSPANHFLFTPLLPSTAVGTLEFRAIQEPVRTIKGLGSYYQAKARKLDLENKVVTCEDLYKGVQFDVAYDYLCVAGGMKSNTFNTHK